MRKFCLLLMSIILLMNVLAGCIQQADLKTGIHKLQKLDNLLPGMRIITIKWPRDDLIVIAYSIFEKGLWRL